MWVRRVLGRLFTVWITILLGGFGGAALVRLSPGFGVDEREMDPRLRADSVDALRRARQEQDNVARFYWTSLKQLARGNLGFSSLLNRPSVCWRSLWRCLRRGETGCCPGPCPQEEYKIHILCFLPTTQPRRPSGEI